MPAILKTKLSPSGSFADGVKFSASPTLIVEVLPEIVGAEFCTTVTGVLPPPPPQEPINDEVNEQAREMASRGLTVAQIADCLGLGERTVYEKQNAYPQFMQAIKRGRAEGLNSVSNALFEKATQGNVTAMIYYLKTRDRANWGENQPEPLREIPPLQIIVDSRAVTDLQ